MSGALAGLVILVIGDSHMMHMLSSLHSQLEDAGAAVHSYAMCGATAEDWVYPSRVASWAGCGKGERHETNPPIFENQKNMPAYSLSALIGQYHPNLVVVQLGDGMLNYGSAALPDHHWILDQVHALAGKIASSNISCDWVGLTWGQDKPPYNKPEAGVKEMVQLLSTSVAPCRYIDSTTFARPGEWPTQDGSHLTPDGYRKWSVEITKKIIQLKSPGVMSLR
jgi:hypothetical protein